MHKRRGVLGKHQKKNALGYALGFVGPHKFLPFTDTSMPIFYLVKTKMRMAIRVAKPYKLCYRSWRCLINHDFKLYDTTRMNFFKLFLLYDMWNFSMLIFWNRQWLHNCTQKNAWPPWKMKLVLLLNILLIPFMAHIDSTLSHIHLHYTQSISCDTLNQNFSCSIICFLVYTSWKMDTV